MARIRTIKPEFFQSEDVAALSYRARLTWIGLWVYADDAGRHKDSPRLIKGSIWPLEDNVLSEDVDQDLEELERAGRIVRYEVDGKRFLEVTNWESHQRIAKPTPSKLPAPSATPTGMVTEGSDTIPGGKGKERKGSGGERSEPHPIPEDFSLTPERTTWAKENTPAVNATLATGDFVDYWRDCQKPKTNWETTWRNWMRRKQQDAEAKGWKPPTSTRDLSDPTNW
ncbi:hypothetical protein GCM10022377_10010 [Zhihengliuella alba]|uniref:Helix-turn-helix domain-containing protein n=1 Tax=Zhihengliuella alba TaxID=547018 RepID=A0ABP7D0C7_9MICC